MLLLHANLNIPPQNIEHIHLMGICGTGMAALAGMLQEAGYTVTGSDQQIYPPMSEFLVERGIKIIEGYAAENLSPAPDLVIVGNVITKTNPEAIALSRTDICYLSFPQALAHFFIRGRTSLVVAGTHGKTTTCSLLASALFHARLDPSFMIGGIVREFNANFRLGKGACFISEGDEYDSAFFDKGSKFLHYRPHIAILTSVEFDHADIFPDLEAIKQTFRKFVALIPEDGLLIANFDDENVRKVIKDARCSLQSYGLSSSYDWSLGERRTKDGKTTFAIQRNGQQIDRLALAMTGRHNCLNALAVWAVLHKLEVQGIMAKEGFSSFQGVKRRQEVRGERYGITVIDDFAHHPTAVKETISALKGGYPGRRLVVVFEPRTNSSRRSIFQKDYVEAFQEADLVLLREPIPLDNFKGELFSSRQLAQDLKEIFELQASAYDNTDAILESLEKQLQQGDVVAILSNGGFDNIHQRLLDQLQERLEHNAE
ncbi:MAG: UDP-N-acetylmuramate:L-alanyl-gamma-D-glutamyl-meso-diaminopimelate ligase [Deltaproteobacteria bacterium]|nr:MAG: UDP-N-acetylmuramate:L-alanyl-gamma-D-glutamyl-meso-diaminopimelate ligase [Deltaproteobacteria bacterium]